MAELRRSLERRRALDADHTQIFESDSFRGSASAVSSPSCRTPGSGGNGAFRNFWASYPSIADWSPPAGKMPLEIQMGSPASVGSRSWGPAAATPKRSGEVDNEAISDPADDSVFVPIAGRRLFWEGIGDSGSVSPGGASSSIETRSSTPVTATWPGQVLSRGGLAEPVATATSRSKASEDVEADAGPARAAACLASTAANEADEIVHRPIEALVVTSQHETHYANERGTGADVPFLALVHHIDASTNSDPGAKEVMHECTPRFGLASVPSPLRLRTPRNHCVPATPQNSDWTYTELDGEASIERLCEKYQIHEPNKHEQHSEAFIEHLCYKYGASEPNNEEYSGALIGSSDEARALFSVSCESIFEEVKGAGRNLVSCCIRAAKETRTVPRYYGGRRPLHIPS